MAGRDTLLEIVSEIASAFDPLSNAAATPEDFQAFMGGFGWDVSQAVTPVADVFTLAGGIVELVASIDDDTAPPPDLGALVHALTSLVTSARDLGSIAGGDLPAGIDLNEFRSQFPVQLVDYLLVRHLAIRYPLAASMLRMVGVIRIDRVAATASRLAYTRCEIAWSDLANVLSDPAAVFKNAFAWGQAGGFRALNFLEAVHQLGRAAGLGARFDLQTPSERTTFIPSAVGNPVELAVNLPLIGTSPVQGTALELGLRTVILPDNANVPLGFAILPYFSGSLQEQFRLTEHFQLALDLSLDTSGGVALELTPNAPPKLEFNLFTGGVSAALKAGASIAYSVEQPFLFFGQADGSRLEAQTLSLGGGVRVQSGTAPKAFVEVRAKGLALVIQPSPEDADGFLAKILPSNMRAEFDLAAGLESQRGFYFEGGGGLEIKLPVHIELGPLEIQGALIGIKPLAGAIAIDLAATLKVDVSVLKAVVENVGLRLTLNTPPGGGQLGPLDLALGFRPPNGVGLAVDAGVVKGGGYLYFDFDREEYAGALELNFADFLDLKAIGLVTTRMPDGTKGFSLLIIITAEFSPGFQLGYGFKLIGVGGLLGLNRTMVLEALALGVRTGAVNGILFPVDPVANAPRIISDLRTIFPPALNRFLIGPMAKIGWGTPTIVSLELGIIIEIPGNVAILGVLRLAIAGDDGDSILQLQVNFIGAIEFDKKRGWFFAALFDSRLLTITIEGEMGLLIAVGDEPNFIMSNGGFHPLFPVPPLPFPTPKRLAFDIIDTDYARIRAEAYFAITPNTVQFGARAQLYFGYSAFSVEGYFAFDALIRFSPPYLLVEVSAGATLKIGGLGVFSIDLALSLEGPTPWRARGHASVNVLFVKVTKEFDETFGEVVTVTLQPIAVVQLLLDELAKASNWRVLPPPSSNLGVSLRTLGLPPETLVLHPLGTLEISQNAVPLGITLEKVGEQIPTDANRLALAVKGGDLVRRSDATRSFAPAQFRKLSDSQKLSAPAFQNEVSGLELGVAGQELRTGRAVERSVRYEVTTLDTLYRRAVKRFTALGRELFAHFIAGASVSKVAVSKSRQQELKPFQDGIAVADESYSVVFASNNSSAAAADFASASAATEWMLSASANDPGLYGQLQVVPSWEKQAAA